MTPPDPATPSPDRLRILRRCVTVEWVIACFSAGNAIGWTLCGRYGWAATYLGMTALASLAWWDLRRTLRREEARYVR